MIIKKGTIIGNQTIIVNKYTGGAYRYIQSYDTETKEAEIYINIVENKDYDLYEIIRQKYNSKYDIRDQIAMYDKNRKGGELLGCDMEFKIVKVTLRFTVAVNKFTGEEIK